MKIGLDFDGVIADCGKLKHDGAKKFYGVDIPPAKFKKEIVVGEKYLTAEQYRELQRIIYRTRETGLLVESVDGALHYVPRLVIEGNAVLIITSRNREVKLEIAKEWFAHQFQGLPLDFISVGPHNSKARAAAGLDLYVDDDLGKLALLVGVVPHRFLFSWGYNASIDAGSIARRVASWEELYHAIQALGGVR